MSFIYKKGDIPLIVLSLHGGQKVLDCKKRTNLSNGKQYVVKNDSYTKKITLETYEHLLKFGLNPYLLVNDVQRKFVDLNRFISDACNHKCDSSMMQYILFHEKLESIVLELINKYGKCFIFDIHGNQHTHNMLQFGFNLTTKQINNNQLTDFSFYTHRDADNKTKEKFLYKELSLSSIFKDLFTNIYPTYNKLDNSYIINNNFRYYSGKQFIVKKYSQICDVVLVELSHDLRIDKQTPVKLALGLYDFYNKIYKIHF